MSNAKDLRNDLKSLKEESESGELLAGSASSKPPVSGVSVPPTPVPSAVTSPRRWSGPGFAAVLVLAIVSVAAWWMSAPRPSPSKGAILYSRVGHRRGEGRDVRPLLWQLRSSTLIKSVTF